MKTNHCIRLVTFIAQGHAGKTCRCIYLSCHLSNSIISLTLIQLKLDAIANVLPSESLLLLTEIARAIEESAWPRLSSKSCESPQQLNSASTGHPTSSANNSPQNLLYTTLKLSIDYFPCIPLHQLFSKSVLEPCDKALIPVVITRKCLVIC